MLQDLLARRRPKKESEQPAAYKWAQAGIDMMQEASVAEEFGSPAAGDEVSEKQLGLIDTMGYTVEKLLGAGLMEQQQQELSRGSADQEKNEAEDDEANDDDDEDCSSEGSDETEVVECEDEDEFEEVMRVLGLQPVSILPNGDLRLPNGSIATNRDVQHIYRQRGSRVDQNQLALSGRGDGPGARGRERAWGGLRSRAQLMLANAPAGCRIAVSQRQQARQDKKIIAIMRQADRYDMKVRMSQNNLQMQNRTKIRTGMGDMSGGR